MTSSSPTAVNPGATLPVGLPRPVAPALEPIRSGDESGQRPGVRGPADACDLVGSALVLVIVAYAAFAACYGYAAYVRGEVSPWPPSCLVGQ